MDGAPQLPVARDKLLFTPGPLTTSLSVKQAMLHDAGSWHYEFNAKVKWVRRKILEVAGLSSEAGWETILLQGSGTFGVEAVFATCVPPNGKVAVLVNAVGKRRHIRPVVFHAVEEFGHRQLRQSAVDQEQVRRLPADKIAPRAHPRRPR